MNSIKTRETFLNFFKEKQHAIVPSAPMVVKNDPTLMFTNAGMNQFKDIFLGNEPAKSPRAADTQKCLRVSGKHNDLDEVGHDTYHHTMFEMLGNWSFGDYFKKEALEWAWELLVDTYGLDRSRMYATVFEGDESDGVPFDSEAYQMWNNFLPKEQILMGNKKDNFWEMGEVGPCGPCSELHYDLRDDSERAVVGGAELVNRDTPEVIEIWNLVFMQFNRKAGGELEPLPAKHVDTGMGFERLCMILQGKKSNYDTDVFQTIIEKISSLCDIKYGSGEMTDIAMRVIADHLRAISFSIADGQLPSNVKAGYVIRRILRRAVRYGYTYLNFREPFICKLVSTLALQMGAFFPEIKIQKHLIERVIEEEENSFLKTLSTGINLLDNIIDKCKADKKSIISGDDSFLLYDTYGFPIDLTELIAREHDMSVDLTSFEQNLQKQKERSRGAAAVETDDWVEITPIKESIFVGYDYLESDVKIARYRKVTTKGKSLYHIVFDQTPFYGNSGGQVGDKGYIASSSERIDIIDTVKENNLTIHIAAKLPEVVDADFVAYVNGEDRGAIASNHTATHLLQKALKSVLGDHVEQKGSMVSSSGLRFDFSHFQKLTNREIREVETIVNTYVRANYKRQEDRNCPIEKAKDLGAMMLFGEKYSDVVRTIGYGDSLELCGGTHVKRTGEIGLFKILSEGAISAGIRRIEARTGSAAMDIVFNHEDMFRGIQRLLNTPSALPALEKMISENNDLKGRVEKFTKENTQRLFDDICSKIDPEQDIIWYVDNITIVDTAVKEIAGMLRNKYSNLVYIVGSVIDNKPLLTIALGNDIVAKGINASTVIRQAAKEIQGGGGGQPFLATAGGKQTQGIGAAIDKAKKLIEEALATK